MKCIIFRFERQGDIDDLMQNADLLDMIEEGEIKVAVNIHRHDFKVYFTEPFEPRIINAVFDLVYTYAFYN